MTTYYNIPQRKHNKLDVGMIRGSGHLVRGFGYLDADREQLRALLAAEIISVLEQQKLTARAAQEITGIAAADFSRLRTAHLNRFTIDRLMTILSKLGQDIEVSVKVHPRATACDVPGSIGPV